MNVGRDRVCVALDRATAADNLALVQALAGSAAWFKVGLRQFYSPGASDVIAAVHASGAKLFLDLKLHDIPKTVGDAALALRSTRPSLVTVHASGGPEMVAAAVEGFGPDVGVLGVTVLTSLDGDDLSAMWGPSAGQRLSETVERLAKATLSAGAAGIVCSAMEAAPMRAALGPDALLITPGIRPSGADHGDQKRVVTPGAAVAAGASLLVVGRPIHQADDPRAALNAIIGEPIL